MGYFQTGIARMDFQKWVEEPIDEDILRLGKGGH
jgi:hypothetical protein